MDGGWNTHIRVLRRLLPHARQLTTGSKQRGADAVHLSGPRIVFQDSKPIS
jgi:hypothetical protein